MYDRKDLIDGRQRTGPFSITTMHLLALVHILVHHFLAKNSSFLVPLIALHCIDDLFIDFLFIV